MITMRSLTTTAIMIGTFLSATASALRAQDSTRPFFEHAEILNAVYGMEMIGIRLAALTAIETPPEALLKRSGMTRTSDLPRFVAGLARQDPSIAEGIGSALDEVLGNARRGDMSELTTSVSRAGTLLREAQGILVSPELRRDPHFRAAVVTMLLLANDGVTEAYEDAAEGDRWAYPNGWAALRRVGQLWGEIRESVSEDVRREIDDALLTLGDLFPSSTPPETFRGDPEEAEAPAERVVGFLEAGTETDLYPGRDLGELVILMQRLAGESCDAVHTDAPDLAVERLSAAAFHYHEHLRRLVSLFSPELHEHITDLFQQGLNLVAEPDTSDLPCDALLEALHRLRLLVAG